jgi:hypothetical protein
VDTNGNGIPDTWMTQLANEVDRVADAYAVSTTGHFRMCLSGLMLPTRVQNFEVVRRASDGALFYRTTVSSEVSARAFADNPDCQP